MKRPSGGAADALYAGNEDIVAAVIERAELHKTIWRIANDLRGSVDGWDFKSYVLGFLFYRFISENLTDYVNATEREAIIAEGGTPEEAAAFDYATLSNEDAEAARDGIVKEKGFFIRPSDLFGNVRAQAAGDENLNETLSYAFRFIENSARGSGSESDLRGLFDDVDVNSTKLGNTVAQRNAKLVKIMDAIGDLPLEHGAAQIDAFGDAYEYLMTMYASSAGKSGGEFYTPQEVAEVLATLALDGRSDVARVYDPCAGSGSLLLKFAKLLGPSSSRQYFGQEINLTTYNLCRINMFLHDVNFSNFDIALGDTLTEPAHWDDQPFDAIVSNPPYSTKWVGKDDIALINDPRFAPAGVLAPKSKADLAFTMHMLHWLAEDGTAAIVEFPGVLYRGGAEGKIRRYLVENNFVHAVIQLPPDLFFGTTIATCIIVLKKARPDHSVLFVDASAECVREGNKNRLTAENQQRILSLVSERQAVDHVAALVSIDDIKDNDWNLSVSSYVEPEDTREQVDIVELNTRIAGIVERQRELRASIDAIVAELEADR
ncbi:type I restriction-modification system, M subunit [Schaalia dentiphila ATCC 17982]|jgi:type I restriction system adenine methylase (hsdM)|uniref:site-specific DNA-methyltransferase (adenine-specific) n=1 Tax=Schaalia dentiphila ATCC 17982 TaxID=411466 RepID=A7B8U6_9ACTO|nr:type I restriction-modification system, M subunit [Schaalia odontolytica ATCC 17982]